MHVFCTWVKKSHTRDSILLFPLSYWMQLNIQMTKGRFDLRVPVYLIYRWMFSKNSFRTSWRMKTYAIIRESRISLIIYLFKCANLVTLDHFQLQSPGSYSYKRHKGQEQQYYIWQSIYIILTHHHNIYYIWCYEPFAPIPLWIMENCSPTSCRKVSVFYNH